MDELNAKVAKRWHVHPETGTPHDKFACESLDCTIETVSNPQKQALTQGTVWKVVGSDGDEFVGKLRSIAKGVLRFDTKEGELREVPSVEVREIKPSTAKIA